MDSRIAKKIRQLTMQGVRKRGEMKRHLDNFVRNEMFKDQKPPPTYRRRFYPRRKDLDYHISKAKLANRLATLDQDNVEAHIEQWKKSSKAMFYFRKRKVVQRKNPEESVWMMGHHCMKRKGMKTT